MKIASIFWRVCVGPATKIGIVRHASFCKKIFARRQKMVSEEKSDWIVTVTHFFIKITYYDSIIILNNNLNVINKFCA